MVYSCIKKTLIHAYAYEYMFSYIHSSNVEAHSAFVGGGMLPMNELIGSLISLLTQPQH